MIARFKVALGLLLLAPAFWILIAAADMRFDHPELTETQLFNTVGWVPYVALILALPGLGFIAWGMQDNEEE